MENFLHNPRITQNENDIGPNVSFENAKLLKLDVAGRERERTQKSGKLKTKHRILEFGRSTESDSLNCSLSH